MTKSRNRDMPPITADLRNLPADFDAIELVRELRRARVVIANYRTARPTRPKGREHLGRIIATKKTAKLIVMKLLVANHTHLEMLAAGLSLIQDNQTSDTATETFRKMLVSVSDRGEPN